MKTRGKKRLFSFLLAVMMLINSTPVSLMADTLKENAFVLVVESHGALVIAPEYITYTEGETIRQALINSGHTFTGIENEWIEEINGVDGKYTRFDEDGEFNLNKQASEISYYRISEDTDGTPTEGLQKLMTAMAEYKEKPSDVQAAAKEEYETASQQFVGIDSSSAAVLADDLNQAMSDYENSQAGATYPVSFTDGKNLHTGVSVTATNSYGKTWEESENGILNLPAGDYSFCIGKDGLKVEGSMTVSGEMAVTAALPTELWLETDTFRLSGSYGADDNKDSTFRDDEFSLGEWNGREIVVPVMDTFTGKIYSYAEYKESLLKNLPTLTAVYESAKTGEKMEENIPFESLTSGVANVLKKGAKGNRVIYRVSSVGEDGYTYSQDYTVTFDRIPTLLSLKVSDQDGTDQVATSVFDSNLMEYTYKVLSTTTSVTIEGTALDSSYEVYVNGIKASEGVAVPVASGEETVIPVVVKAGEYENTYTLTIQPGAGQKINFLAENKEVTVEVVNSNGEMIPYAKFSDGNGNRYQYVLVPGETYSYIATIGTYYHQADEFTIEDLAGSTITVDVKAEDWLTGMYFGSASSPANKGDIQMDAAFAAKDHLYQVECVDTEHLPYIWVNSSSDYTIQGIYKQIHSASLYMGKEKIVEINAGASEGTELKRFLMAKNPHENKLVVRLSKVVSGTTYYQDYEIMFNRTLTLQNISAECDKLAASLVQEDGTVGFNPYVKEYWVTVSMAATEFYVSTECNKGSLAYGEESIGYRVLIDEKNVTEEGGASIKLSGTIETQDVTVTVENDKAPNGASDYILHVLKSPPVEASFKLNPEDALLAMYETMSGQRLWPGENGVFQLCEGYSYQYSLTKAGYISNSGILDVTRNDENQLVVLNGEEEYIVTESGENGGAVEIDWELLEAPANEEINAGMESSWSNFRGNEDNNAVTDAKTPISAEDGTLYWANQIGKGFDSDAVGSPIIVNDELITYAGDTIYRIDAVSGEIIKTGKMDHKSAFSITPPSYYEGMVFVALSNGTVQAFNAVTLESLWIYYNPLGGQPNCPITVKDGYLYTGFWNGEKEDADFVCLSVTDENPSEEKEEKCASWYYRVKGGYYWAGSYVSEDITIVGTDDGTSGCTGQSSSLLLFDTKTGELLDSWAGLDGDIRSTVAYDTATDAYYFTSKGGTFYSVQVNNTQDGWKFTENWNVKLSNGTDSTPMSTSSSSVYNGRAYVGVSGEGQFSAYSGHNITVIDLTKRAIAYRVETQGYPQTSGLLTTAYEE